MECVGTIEKAFNPRTESSKLAKWREQCYRNSCCALMQREVTPRISCESCAKQNCAQGQCIFWGSGPGERWAKLKRPACWFASRPKDLKEIPAGNSGYRLEATRNLSLEWLWIHGKTTGGNGPQRLLPKVRKRWLCLGSWCWPGIMTENAKKTPSMTGIMTLRLTSLAGQRRWLVISLCTWRRWQRKLQRCEATR